MLFVLSLELWFFLSLQLRNTVVAQTCTHGSVRVVHVSYQCGKCHLKSILCHLNFVTIDLSIQRKPNTELSQTNCKKTL